MKFICLFIVLSIASCSDQDSAKKPYQEDLRSAIIGQWGNPTEDSPVWKISEDTFYYYRLSHGYPYLLKGNDIVIDNGESPWVLKNVSIIKDTMLFYDEAGGGVLKACRFKTK
jgi:hypothetical protein